MGLTGTGKSSFIKCLTGDDVKIGHNLAACTSEVGIYSFNSRTCSVALIDTPGFDDTYRSDSEVLQDVAYFLGQIYSNKELKLAGILYLHRITDNRMAGSTLKNLHMFEALCETTDLSHVVLATTMWDKMADTDNRKKAIRFEQELQRDYWGDMIDFGSKIFRHNDTKGSAMQIVNHTLSLRGDMVLDIQREMIDQKRSLDQTSAGQQLQKDLLEERKRHEKNLKEAQEAHQAAIKAGNNRMIAAMEKQERRHAEKLKEFEKELDNEKNNIRKDFELLQEEGRKRYQDMIDRAERDKRRAEEKAIAAENELRKVRTTVEGFDAKIREMEQDSKGRESKLLAQLASERLESQTQMERIQGEAEEYLRQAAAIEHKNKPSPAMTVARDLAGIFIGSTLIVVGAMTANPGAVAAGVCSTRNPFWVVND